MSIWRGNIVPDNEPVLSRLSSHDILLEFVHVSRQRGAQDCVAQKAHSRRSLVPLAGSYRPPTLWSWWPAWTPGFQSLPSVICPKVETGSR